MNFYLYSNENLTYYFVVLFGIPVATFGRVDRGSEVEVEAGAHVYPNGPKSVLNCEKLTFIHLSLKNGLLILQ
jgi:hypothetical protein